MELTLLTKSLSIIVGLLNTIALILTIRDKINSGKKNQRVVIIFFSLSFIILAVILVMMPQAEQNSPPSINALVASTTLPNTSQEIIISVLAFDADENDNLFYVWSASSGEITSGITNESSIKYKAPAVKTQVKILVTVADMKGGMAQKSINLQVI